MKRLVGPGLLVLAIASASLSRMEKAPVNSEAEVTNTAIPSSPSPCCCSQARQASIAWRACTPQNVYEPYTGLLITVTGAWAFVIYVCTSAGNSSRCASSAWAAAVTAAT